MADDVIELELEYEEEYVKPEVAADITPTYESQTVVPPTGKTFNQVNVDPIPDPTEVKEIGSNGDHDVRRYGTARVNVQPDLQAREVTPTKQTQTVTPDSDKDGLSEVQVNPIPSQYIVPEGSLNITENANDIDVTEKASVNVNVQPNLQTGEATPTTSTQTVTPDGQHDGFSSFQVNPIPSEYIVPTGTKPITENGTGIDVSGYAKVDVAVPIPEEYTKGGSYWDGSLTEYCFDPDCSITGFPNYDTFKNYSNLTTIRNLPKNLTTLPRNFAYGCSSLVTCELNQGLKWILNYAFQNCTVLEMDALPDSIIEIGDSAFAQCKAVSFKKLPSSLTTVGAGIFTGCTNIEIDETPIGVTEIKFFSGCTKIPSLTFLGDITYVSNGACMGTNCTKYDFRNNTQVPQLASPNAFPYNQGKIVVPDALVSSWKTATNWAAHANDIIGVTDYDNQ